MTFTVLCSHHVLVWEPPAEICWIVQASQTPGGIHPFGTCLDLPPPFCPTAA